MKRLPISRPLMLTLLIFTTVVALTGGLGGIAFFQPRFAVRGLSKINPEVLFEVRTEQKIAALTIDDGPHADITPGVLDLLKEYDIQATFFILGDHIPGNESILQRIESEGHEIGNHLMEDRPSITLSDEEFLRQMQTMDAWVDPAAKHRWLRPGSGWFTPQMVQQAAQHGYRLCLGSIFPHDDRIHDSQTLAGTVLSRLHPGAIIILHDGQSERAGLTETLHLVLKGAQEQGYQLMTVSQLVDHP